MPLGDAIYLIGEGQDIMIKLGAGRVLYHGNIRRLMKMPTHEVKGYYNNIVKKYAAAGNTLVLTL